MVDYIVPSGVYSEERVKLVIGSINNVDDPENLIQKLDKLGVSVDDYLTLCDDERFRQQIMNNAFYMLVIPNTARFLSRHMQAAMKGGRGSARVILKLWAAFNKTLEATAYDRKGGDTYIDFRQMSQEQLDRELDVWQGKLAEMRSIVPPPLHIAPTPVQVELVEDISNGQGPKQNDNGGGSKKSKAPSPRTGKKKPGTEA